MTDEQKERLLDELEWAFETAKDEWCCNDEERAQADRAKRVLRRLVEAVGEWQREAKTLRKTYIGPAQCLVTELRDFDPFEEGK